MVNSSMLRDSKPLESLHENGYATFDTFFGLCNLTPVRSVLYNLKSHFHGVWEGLAKCVETSCTVSSLRRNLRFQFVFRFHHGSRPCYSCWSRRRCSRNPPIPAPVVPPVVIPAPVAPLEAAPVVGH